MIISKTPFRISFAGGGSDISSFYRHEQGAVLSTTINKYMYIAIHPFFEKDKIQLKYSKTELVSNVDEIKHPIFKEVLDMYGLTGVDLNSIADIPAGTGLGSSSTFTVGLLNATRAYLGKYTGPEKLSRLACEIEIERLATPIGKQDQYAAAYGGMNLITFNPDETVKVEKVLMNPQKKIQLENNLIMVYIGGEHSANKILEEQSAAINNEMKFQTQRNMVKLAYQLHDALVNNNIDDFGNILHEGWMMKKSLVNSISNDIINDVYQMGLKAGATGGKLLGAGGAGFLLFYCNIEKQEQFMKAMSQFSIMSFSFDNNGSQIIYIDDK